MAYLYLASILSIVRRLLVIDDCSIHYCTVERLQVTFIFYLSFIKEIRVANTAQARKRARQNTKRRQNSASQRSMVRTYLKRVDAAIAAKDYDAATEAYKKAVPVLDRMADKGIIHKNKAARRKSRLNKTIKGLQA